MVQVETAADSWLAPLLTCNGGLDWNFPHYRQLRMGSRLGDIKENVTNTVTVTETDHLVAHHIPGWRTCLDCQEPERKRGREG